MNDRNASWYKVWFNSPYYHLLYQNRDEEEAAVFINKLIKYLNPVKGSTFLDLACGKGRHSLFLHDKGFEVSGVDLSTENIKEAKNYERKGVDFHVHDMRLPFRPNSFNYVVNLFTSFGYFETFEENLEVLNSVYANLKFRGKFVLDFMNVTKVISEIKSEEVKKINGIEFLIKRSVIDNFIIKEISFEDKGESYRYYEKVHALTLTDFRSLFNQSGFEIIDIFGSYSLENFKEDNSERLIIIAQKFEY